MPGSILTKTLNQARITVHPIPARWRLDEGRYVLEDSKAMTLVRGLRAAVEELLEPLVTCGTVSIRSDAPHIANEGSWAFGGGACHGS